MDSTEHTTTTAGGGGATPIGLTYDPAAEAQEYCPPTETPVDCHEQDFPNPSEEDDEDNSSSRDQAQVVAVAVALAEAELGEEEEGAEEDEDAEEEAAAAEAMAVVMAMAMERQQQQQQQQRQEGGRPSVPPIVFTHRAAPPPVTATADQQQQQDDLEEQRQPSGGGTAAESVLSGSRGNIHILGVRGAPAEELYMDAHAIHCRNSNDGGDGGVNVRRGGGGGSPSSVPRAGSSARRGRRGSASVGGGDTGSGGVTTSRYFEMATAATADPADVQGFVQTIFDQHSGTIAGWEARVVAAEVRCGRQTRTGGRPVAPPPADQGFLERASKGVSDHISQTWDALDILAAQERVHSDDAPVFQARSVADRRAGEAGEAWAAECRRLSGLLRGNGTQAEALLGRIEGLLSIHRDTDYYNPLIARRGRQSSPARSGSTGRLGRRASSPAAGGPEENGVLPAPPRRSGSVGGRRGSVQQADGQLTLAIGFRGVEGGGGGSVQRSRGAISPGNPSSPSHNGSTPRANHRDNKSGYGGDLASTSPTPGAPPTATAKGGSSPTYAGVRRGSQLGGGGSAHRRRDSSASQPTSTNAHHVLHPDTVAVARSDRGGPGSSYDRSTQYGRMSPVRRHSLTRPDPADEEDSTSSNNTGRIQYRPGHLITYEGGGGGGGGTPSRGESRRGSRASSAVRASRDGREVQRYDNSEDGNGGRPATAVATYSSPRGPSQPVPGTEPRLSDTQRKQLLLTIDYYEKHVGSLRKADLQTARDCFVELYGQQRGLRQYCNWIDELALQALRQAR